MSMTGNIHLLPPPWDLKRPRQRDGDQTRKRFVQDVAKTTGRTAEATECAEVKSGKQRSARRSETPKCWRKRFHSTSRRERSHCRSRRDFPGYEARGKDRLCKPQS
jgi:hypothetical protein